jgi:hypothetical protein
MTDEEIRLLNESAHLVSQEKSKLRARHRLVEDGETSSAIDLQASGSALPQKADAPNAHPPNVLTPHRSIQERRQAGPLYIDTTVNSNTSAPSQPLSRTSARSSVDGTVDDTRIDPRNIFFKQDMSYWTGRYTSICDRMRNEAMQVALFSHHRNTAKTGADAIGDYEVAENKRIHAALSELRSFCKTEKARQSFITFEKHLKKDWPRSMLVDPAHAVKARGVSNAKPSGAGEQRTRLSAGHLFKSHAPLPNIFGRLALTKCQTTGDISLSARQAALSLNNELGKGHRGTQRSRQTVASHHRRKSSSQTLSSTIPSTADSMSFVPKDIARAERPEQISGIGSSDSTGQSPVPSEPQRPALCHHRTNSSTASQYDEIRPGLTAASLESGHGPPPPSKPPPGAPWPKIRLVDDEKFVRSTRLEPRRRSSGDVMKELWQLGVDQVMKMGRKVSGSGSWTASTEDLDRIVSGTSSKSGKKKADS